MFPWYWQQSGGHAHIKRVVIVIKATKLERDDYLNLALVDKTFLQN